MHLLINEDVSAKRKLLNVNRSQWELSTERIIQSPCYRSQWELSTERIIQSPCYRSQWELSTERIIQSPCYRSQWELSTERIIQSHCYRNPLFCLVSKVNILLYLTLFYPCIDVKTWDKRNSTSLYIYHNIRLMKWNHHIAFFFFRSLIIHHQVSEKS